MRGFNYLLSAVMLISVISCAPNIKDGPRKVSVINIPEHLLKENIAIKTQEDDLHLEHWWEIFEDDQLNTLIKYAHDNNPNIAEALSRQKVAQAEITRITANQYPTVYSNTAVIHQHISTSSDHGIYNGETYNLAIINPIDFNYHLDVWGSDRDLIASSQANFGVTRARYKQSEISLRQSVIKTYLALKFSKELINTQKQVFQAIAKINHVKQAAFQTGLQPQSYVIQSKVNLLQNEVALSSINQQKNALQFALAALLGKDPDSEDVVFNKSSVIPDQLILPRNLSLDKIVHRPDIQESLWKVTEAFHQEKVAQKAYYPNVNLRGLLGLNSLGLSKILDIGSLAYAAGPVISLPIFDHKELQGRFEATEANYDALVYAYNQTILNAIKEIATNLSNLENTKNILYSQKLTFQDRSRFMKVAETEYNSGLTDQVPYLEAEVAEKVTYIEYLNAELKWCYAIVDMATSLDGEVIEETNVSKN